MDVLNFGAHLIGNIFMMFYSMICWAAFAKINRKQILKIATIFIFALSIAIISQYFPNPVKMINVFLILMFACYLLVTKDLKKSIFSVISTQLILWATECSFIIFILVFNPQIIDKISIDIMIYLFLVIYMIIVDCILLKFKIPQKIYNILVNSTSFIKSNETLIYSFIIIAVIIIATTESYMKLPKFAILITNIIMAIIFITIVIISSKTKDNYNKISSKYQTSISSLKEYEVMINKFGVYTHENRNEFYTIRNMLKEGDNREKVIKYIDALINNKIQDNEKIMKKTAKIPSGGLRATIYSKLCLMDKLKIKYKLNISRDVSTTDLINLDEDLTLKICKILGVFLDNSIDAVKKLKKREIYIEIYILNKYLCIDITNNFKGNLDLDKISEAKYTTKGEGHGYGLTLVKQILNDESKKLENEKSINRDAFTQTLKIKM